jgi:hypothetical protein
MRAGRWVVQGLRRVIIARAEKNARHLRVAEQHIVAAATAVCTRCALDRAVLNQ